MNFLIDSPVDENGTTSNAVATNGKDIAIILNTDNFVYIKAEVSNDNATFVEFPIQYRWDEDDNSFRPAMILTKVEPIAFNALVSGYAFVRLVLTTFPSETANVSASYRFRN